jgi:predicted nucleic acid-binding protein
MSEVIQIDKYTPSTSESFFFDNNVWMFLYYQIANYGRQKQNKYSQLLERLISLRCLIFINSLLLSEFINTCLRSDFKIWCDLEENKGRKLKFKEDFVGSASYKESVEEILSSVSQIRKVTTAGNDDFNALNIDAILAGMSLRDFNDNYYLALAERKKWTIVTDDSDMLSNVNHKVKIVTAKQV